MYHKCSFLYLLLIIFSYQNASAQDTITKKDSAAMYRKIEKYSQKRKVTKFLHGLIFEPLTPKTIKARKKIQRKRFGGAQGKIIRKINITTLDPFGYSETDTAARPKKSLSTLGNRFHLKTKKLTIWNLLLIRRNQPLDSLLVKESERLIRTQRYIRRVQITPVLISKNSDSIDVDIRVLDSWSFVPDVSISTNSSTYAFTERNFMGFGHQLENKYRKNSGRDAYSVRYTIPNVMNTYIRTSLQYDIDPWNNYTKSINIERPFFSPYARWAGGIYVGQDYKKDTLANSAGQYARLSFKHSTKDIWGAHAYQLFKGESEDDRTTNLITSARFLKINYQERPSVEYDSINFFSSETTYLFGLGIASRQFIEDKYIFNYGIIEDVPIGKSFGITAGVQDKNNVKRLYLGGRLTFGRYYKWGYLSSNFEYGTYLNHGVGEQGALSFQSNYFTNLYEAGSWKFRQFIKTQMIIGNSRQNSVGDQLTLNGDRGMQGFHTAIFGTKKLLMTLQTQSYSPWNAWGFRLNPYLSYTAGLLGNSGSGFSDSKLYSQISLGVLISNDYLVFSTFQFSFSFYPDIPNTGNNIFKTNAFNTEDFGFQDFELAKPRTALYE